MNVDYWNSIEFPLKPCTPDLFKQTELKEYYLHQQPTNYCIDWNKLNEIPMEGTFDSVNFRYLHLTF